MKDFFNFRKLIAPVLIQIIFWVAAVSAVLGGLIVLIDAATNYYRFWAQFIPGMLLLVLGPVVARLWAEFMTVVFRTAQNVSDMRDVAVREAHEKYEERHGNPGKD